MTSPSKSVGAVAGSMPDLRTRRPSGGNMSTKEYSEKLEWYRSENHGLKLRLNEVLGQLGERDAGGAEGDDGTEGQDRAALEEELEDKERRLEELEGRLEEIRPLYESLVAEMAEKERLAEDARQDADVERLRREELEALLADKAGQSMAHEDQSRQLADKEALLAKKEEQLSHKEAQLSDKDRQMTAKDEQLESLRLSLQNLQSKLQDSEEDKGDKVRALEAAQKEAEGEVEKLMEQLMMGNGQAGDASADGSSATRGPGANEEQAAELSVQIHHLQDEVQQARLKLAEMANLEQEHQRTKQQLEELAKINRKQDRLLHRSKRENQDLSRLSKDLSRRADEVSRLGEGPGEVQLRFSERMVEATSPRVAGGSPQLLLHQRVAQLSSPQGNVILNSSVTGSLAELQRLTDKSALLRGLVQSLHDKLRGSAQFLRDFVRRFGSEEDARRLEEFVSLEGLSISILETSSQFVRAADEAEGSFAELASNLDQTSRDASAFLTLPLATPGRYDDRTRDLEARNDLTHSIIQALGVDAASFGAQAGDLSKDWSAVSAQRGHPASPLVTEVSQATDASRHGASRNDESTRYMGLPEPTGPPKAVAPGRMAGDPNLDMTHRTAESEDADAADRTADHVPCANCEVLRDELKKTQETVAETSRLFEGLDKELEEATQREVKLKVEKEMLETRMEDLVSQHSELSQAFQTSKAALREAEGKWHQERGQLQSQLEEKVRELESAKDGGQQTEALTAQLQETKKALASEERKALEAKAETEAVRAQLGSAEAKLGEAQRRWEAVETETKAVTEELSLLREKEAEAVRKLRVAEEKQRKGEAQRQRETARLAADLDKARKEHQDLAQAAKDAQDSQAAMKAQLKRAVDFAENCRPIVSQTDSKNNTDLDKGGMDAVLGRIRSLEAQLAKTAQDAAAKKLAMDQLSAVINHNNEELKQRLEQERHLRAALAHAKAQATTPQAAPAAPAVAAAAEMTQMTEASEEAAEQEREIRDCHALIRTLMEKNASLEGELGAAKENRLPPEAVDAISHELRSINSVVKDAQKRINKSKPPAQPLAAAASDQGASQAAGPAKPRPATKALPATSTLAQPKPSGLKKPSALKK